MAHTPGPWEVGDLDRNDQRTVIGGLGSLVAVCAHECVSSNEPIMEANACVISAAPDLLDALRSLIEIGKRDMSNTKYDGYFDAARAAIAKAEGR